MQALRRLFSRPAQPTQPTQPDKNRLLKEGALEGNLQKVRKAVELGADVNQRFSANLGQGFSSSTRTQLTALMLAARYPTILAYLIEKGADVNLQDYAGFTVLHIAARGQYNDSLRLLLAAGADPTITTEYGFRAIDFYDDDDGEIITNIFGAEAVANMERRHEASLARLRLTQNEIERINSISLNAAEHKGNLTLPPGTENAITYDEFEDGDEVIVLNDKKNSPSHRFKRSGLEQWIRENPSNPLTREPITQAGISRYTARIGGARRKQTKKNKKRRAAKKTRSSR